MNAKTQRRSRAAFFAGVLTAFLAAFFAGDFLAVVFLTAAFFAGVFLTADFLAGDLLTAFFATAFFAAFLAGLLCSTSPTVVTAASNAVLIVPATSDAMAIPYPTASPAFSTIDFSAILRPSILRFLHRVELYINRGDGTFFDLSPCSGRRGGATVIAGFSRRIEPLRRVGARFFLDTGAQIASFAVRHTAL